MAKEVIMKCPSCGTIVRGRYGFFNKEFSCTGCGKAINPKKDAYEIVECSVCGNAVIYDTRIGKEQICPVCNASLSTHAITDLTVTCPSCGVKQTVKNNETAHTCAVCNYTYDVKKVKALEDAEENGTAAVISVPEDNRDIIWGHPMKKFPFSSQVVVPEGYTALILRDGICSAPSEPGKYVLSDTIRTKAQQLEYALYDSTAQISVQVLFVRKLVDKSFAWTGQKQPVADHSGKTVGTLGCGGSVTLCVTDAKRFAEFVGYEAASADQLIGWQNGQPTKLCEYVTGECFEAALQVLVSAVNEKGYAYKGLEVNKFNFKNQVKDIVDGRLDRIGLQTSLFSLDFIRFEEDDSIIADQLTAKLEKENQEKIRRYVQRPFSWEAPSISVHMKGDITLAADLVFGGRIKFRIADDRFFANSEVQYWVKEGVNERQIDEYCAELAAMSTGKVIGDILQPMINDTDADIRDLSIYYQYIRGNIVKELKYYFEKDGLSIDLFTMEEKSRSQSGALNAKGEVEVHKSKAQIEMDLYAFDQKQAVEKDSIERHTKVDIDTNALNEQQALTRNEHGRAQDEIDRMYIRDSVVSAGEDIQRQREKKYESWNRQDAEDKIAFAHQQEVNAYDRARQISDLEHDVVRRSYGYQEDISELKHKAVMNGYDQSADVKEAVHRAEMNEYTYAQDRTAAEHNSAMQKIGNATEEKMELHYLNQQEIDNHAKELYAQWEMQKKMEEEQLLHRVKMDETSWSAEKNSAREKNALEHELQQSEAENERIINGILRKIAESDMELTEKKDAYNRLLKNQSEEDTLRRIRDDASARADIYYNDAHMKNTLKQEEMDISYTAGHMKNSLSEEENAIFYKNEHMKNLLTKEERELLDEMAGRENLRREEAKEAEFNRSMQVKEKDTAHEMDILKLEYERYQTETSLKQELREKELEIERLRVMLEHQERMGDQNVRITDIQSSADVRSKEAEYRYRTEHERADADRRFAAERAERESRERLERENRESRERTEREDRESREKIERENRESREKTDLDKLETEKLYMRRADDLMSRMLSIQAAIRNHSLDNEGTAINANADVEIARAQVNHEANNIAGNTNYRIREMEDLIKEMNSSIQVLNDSVKKLKKEQREQAERTYGYAGGPSYQVPVYQNVPGYNVQPQPNYTQMNYTQPQPNYVQPGNYVQSGSAGCPYCGAAVSQYAAFCPRCGRKIK